MSSDSFRLPASAALVLIIYVASCGVTWAQGPTLLSETSVEGAPAVHVSTSGRTDEHRFWDTKNRALFAGVAAFSAADFFVTRSNLQNGGTELNPLTRPFAGSTAGLAVNFVGETAGVIGLSYFFHKTGHHKLERVVSVFNIGGSSAAVAYGLAHR